MSAHSKRDYGYVYYGSELAGASLIEFMQKTTQNGERCGKRHLTDGQRDPDTGEAVPLCNDTRISDTRHADTYDVFPAFADEFVHAPENCLKCTSKLYGNHELVDLDDPDALPEWIQERLSRKWGIWTEEMCVDPPWTIERSSSEEVPPWERDTSSDEDEDTEVAPWHQ
ncbi:hypothetical protein ACFQE1_00380 [Halobium palmae]|uniref:Uncharacterized protein n=1 Tax=Halobium palmae TaxID=1776492 RepID=A0ABD5RUL7_9EURY